MRTAVVVVDTTELFNQFELKSRSWDRLFAVSRTTNVRVVVPYVVVRETGRHFRRQASSADRGAITQLQEAMHRLSRVSSVPNFNIGEIRRELRQRRDEYEQWLLTELVRRGAEVAPLPEMANSQLLDWAIMERQPFKSTQEGFRDSLVWGTVLDVAAELGEDDLVVFVTGNVTDFCDPDGQLGPDLLNDLHFVAERPDVVVAPDLRAALELLAPEVEEVRLVQEALRSASGDPISSLDAYQLIRGPVLNACEGLVGRVLTTAGSSTIELDGNSGTVGLSIDLPPELEEPSVYELEPILESLVWNSYDEYEGGIILGSATIRADLTIDGKLSADEIGEAERRWGIDVLDDGLSDIDELEDDEDLARLAWVTVGLEVELTFHISINAASESVDDVELEGGIQL